ncbi:MAG: putative baseplate assembly protein, partial [Acidobacteriota bacterium]
MSCNCPGCLPCATPDDVRTACDCCAGVAIATPRAIHNLPGRAQLDWRVGTYGTFLDAMEAGIRRGPSLRRLATRRADDWTIGLLDAWAVALEVLTFYQERWGQELYLGTAVERRSLIELARLIGYRPAPGVAARVPLAFGLDDGPGSPTRLVIPAGTRAQSLPQAKDELPQSFETGHDLDADVRFGQLHPRRTAAHPAPALGQTAFWIRGVDAGLRRGDALLLVVDPAAEDGQQLLRVRTVEARPDENRTLVRCVDAAIAPAAETDALALDLADQRLDGTVDANAWTEAPDLIRALATPEGDPTPEELIAHSRQTWPRAPAFDPTDFAGPGLFALRVRARPFGHSAPRRATLPEDMRPSGDWDTGTWPIHRTAEYGVNMAAGLKGAIHTDQSHPEIVEGSWVVLKRVGSGSDDVSTFTVDSATEESLADFGISGKATRLETTRISGDGKGTYHLRTTTIFAAAERLALAHLPIEHLPLGTTDLLLETVVPHLEPGRLLLIEGELWDQPGVVAREEVIVDAVRQGTHTWITLATGLVHDYALQTVTIHGNVAEATHGESRTEVLGSGDASQPHQRFRLRSVPVTYTPSADAPGGAASSLAVWVDGVRHTEVPSLYGREACERVYTVRRDDRDRTTVQFGDGVNGARLPTGADNVVAALRVGIGRAGLVGPGRISLLQSPPLGVRTVINPVASADAEDPEAVDAIRENAPSTVRTLGRVVSLTDVEDFARTWAGVAKARADRLWDGQRRVIFVSVAGTDGATPSGALLDDLRRGLDRARDARMPLRLGAFRALRFGLRVRLRVAEDRRFEDVADAVRSALRHAFAFDARRLGQAVRRADLAAVAHSVDGVIAIDVDAL